MSTTAQRKAKFQSKAPWIMTKLMADFKLDLLSSAAILGNLGHECAGFTLLQEGKPMVAGSKGGYGWPQWTGPRRRAYEAYCARNDLDASSDKANYAYLFIELSGAYHTAITKVAQAVGLSAKVKAFELQFEKAAAQYKHYDSREIYAKWALEAYEHSGGLVPAPHEIQAPKPAVVAVAAPVIALEDEEEVPAVLAVAGIVPGSPVAAPEIGMVATGAAVHPKPPTTILGKLGSLFSGNPTGISANAALAADKARPGLAPNGDPVLYDAQEKFISLGYTEVGDPDGLTGRKTRTAISLFREDNSLPPGTALDDVVLAAMSKAKALPPNAKRANLQADDLRRAGNAPVSQFDKLRKGGIAGLFLSALGGADSSGLLDTAKGALSTGNDTLAQAQSIMGQVQSAIAMIVSVVQWCIHHWWIIGIVGGFFFLKWVLKGTMEMVILGRQSGLLQFGKRQ